MFNFRGQGGMSDPEAERSSEQAGQDVESGRQKALESVVPSMDQLHYVADLVLELRDLAERAGAPTLASLLSLAYAEAHREMRRR